jgi:hypothetical protein
MPINIEKDRIKILELITVEYNTKQSKIFTIINQNLYETRT